MRRLFLFGFGMALLSGAAQAQHRELGAHEHGRGTLNIAIEGTRVSMELEVPGADIVGFEHEAKTKKQKVAVDKAKAQLAAPLALFVLPAAAGCKVEETKVEIETGDHDAKGDPKVATEAPKDAAKAADHDDHGHSQFHVEYALACTQPASLTGIEFAYFRTFAAAQRLNVNVITSKGQTKFEVTRAKPRIDLAGMM